MRCHIASILTIATFSLLASVTSQTYPRLELVNRDGTIRNLGNNSFINRASIDERTGGSLRCVSNNAACCSGNWFDNRGQIVPARESHANFSFFTTTPGVVDGISTYTIKYRRDASQTAVGIFRCDIPDLFGVMESLFVYIGSRTIGEGTLRSIRISYERHPLFLYDYQIPQFILSCVSEGGPVTTVQWWRNGIPVTEDENHVVTQTILSTSQNAIYDNKLTVWGREGGSYRCRISNNIPDFDINLTYLSHNSSYIGIEVAESPRNVEHVQASPTSYIIYWDTPRNIPDGYVIFYNLTRDRVHSVRVNASSMLRQTYELEGLSDGNYSISMVALSRHLPSSLVGSPILSVADITPSVAITMSTSESVAGSSYMLTCSVTVQLGLLVIPDIVWSGHGIGMSGVTIGRTISRDGVHTRVVTLRPLLLAHGGTYTCTASFSLNGVDSRNGVEHTILTVLIPPPSMIVRRVGDATPYIGNDISVECLVELDEAVSYSEVELDTRWLASDGRSLSPASATALVSSDTKRSAISFTYLLESDSGDYTCEATLTPRDLRVNSPPLVTPYVFNLTVIVPTLVMETSPSVIRILDIPPYNNFLISCTVWAEVEGERVPLPISLDWIKRVEMSGGVRFSPGTPEGEPQLRPDPADGYYSVLRGSETNSGGQTQYRCRAVFVQDSGGAVERQTSNSLVAVVGPIAPMVPLSIKAVASNNTSVMIQWEISSISYTPETYHVEYGTNSVYFDSYSPGQESGPDIRTSNRIYSQILTGLAPGVEYYYRVVATNSVGSTASVARSVRTTSVLLIEPSGVPQVGDEYSLMCSIMDDTNDNYTRLEWINNRGMVLKSDESGSQTGLQLVFEDLQLSDVGDYTCSVTFSSGNSRQITQTVLATVPPPEVHLIELDRPAHGILYSGLNLTLRCSVNISELSVPFVTVSIHWLKDGTSFRNCSDLRRESDTNYYCLGTLNHLSHVASNGSYSCRAVLTPTAEYPLLRSRSSTSNNINLGIAIPKVSATISSPFGRLLDIPPYNKFEASCSGSIVVPGLAGNAKLQTYWAWRKRGVGEENFNGVPLYAINSVSLWSSLNFAETRNGNVTYQCIFSIEGVDNIFTSDQLTVSVIGTSPPRIPQEVQVTKISSDELEIEWRISSISYTPETYLVEYGTSNESLVPYGDPLISGDNIEVAETIYRVQLKGLSPGTKYYYVVVARNSARTTRTKPQFIFTKEIVPDRVAYVIALRLNDTTLSISWGGVESENGNITHYEVWINSTVHDHHKQDVDSHFRELDFSQPRSIVVSGLKRKTEYVVYVAAVNGAGRGAWQQTQNAVTTQGLEREESGGDVGMAVGVTIFIIFIILTVIIATILLVLFCLRRRKSEQKGFVIREEMRASGLLNHIIVKEKEEKEMRYSVFDQTDGGESGSERKREGGQNEEGEVGDDGELGYETEGASERKYEGTDTMTTDSDEDTSSKGKLSSSSTDDEHTV